MLFNADNFGLGMEDLLKAYEDAMGPAAAEEIVSLPDPVAPMDPKFPNKNHRPLHDKVEVAKNRLTKGLSAQEAKPIQELMAEVDRCLEVADPEAQEFVHMTYTGDVKDGDRAVEYESVLNNRSGNLTKEGFDLLAGGRFQDKVRSVVRRDNPFSFEIGDTDRLNGPLSEEDRRVRAGVRQGPDFAGSRFHDPPLRQRWGNVGRPFRPVANPRVFSDHQGPDAGCGLYPLRPDDPGRGGHRRLPRPRAAAPRRSGRRGTVPGRGDSRRTLPELHAGADSRRDPPL